MMIWFFTLGCVSSQPIISGEVPSKGDSTYFMPLCEAQDATAVALKTAAQADSCSAAWDRLSTVTTINLTPVETISSLDALQGFDNLESLTAYGKGISDLRPLSGLVRLESIYLVRNNITDISVLEPLTQLRVLRVDGNAITDISVLTKLQKLEKLGLDDNKIEDFRPIIKLDRIQALNTNKNPVKLEFCPISETQGPRQLRKYCKRMKKHLEGQAESNEIGVQDAVDPKSPPPLD